MSQYFPASFRSNSGKFSDDHDYDEQSSSFNGVYIPAYEGTLSGSDDDEVSDCESVATGTRVVENQDVETNRESGGGLVKLGEGDKLHRIIEKKFKAKMSEIGVNVEVECVLRNMFNANVVSQAKVNTFQIFSKAVEAKNAGVANVKYAWFGGSKDEINKIVKFGFGYENVKRNGVVLSADHSPLESVESATVDGDGVKHILLCRVILGKTELVSGGSTQCHPSCEDFDSGVDDLVSPKKYVVWSSRMNTHILPEFVVSFKTQRNVNRAQVDEVRTEKPVSPWIPIPDLIANLSKILPPKAIKDITQYHHSYIDRKISRRDMIRGIREVTGDTMLLKVLKDFTEQWRISHSGSIFNRFKS